MQINNLRLWLITDSILNRADAEKIRGYLGNFFWNNSYAHQHDYAGDLIYRYPRVQYKVINGKSLLIGFNEGSEIVEKTFYNIETINLGKSSKVIINKELESCYYTFAVIPNQIKYSFLTPWLALNEKNYEKYMMLGDWRQRKELLEKILVGNIISVSKSLGYTVDKPIEAGIERFKEVRTTLKGTSMIGFLGTFFVNFEIPDFWGIGKSVSRGFGTIKKIY
ncbi:CRISPR-associated endonuclease Cas6 [Calditerrivibrio sp.]|uniref:CRISPR-associated endonuclease Cas6 n=1 Tax=Calditerrivibrio sp. TaxID=2792612 RepID=UPI003D10F82B